MDLVIIDNPHSIKDLVDYLKNFQIVAFDTETTGVTKGSQVIGMSLCAESNKAFYIVLLGWDTDTQKLKEYISIPEVLPVLTELKTKDLIMHNGVFDCMICEDYFKVSLIESLHTDTMILAHLLNENRRVGLKELGKEYFGEEAAEEQQEMKSSVLANGGKLTKSCYEMYKADPKLMAKYGAKDALLTYNLFLELLPELEKQGLWDFFYKDESMPLLKGPTYELNTMGLKVDMTKLLELQKSLEVDCLEADAYILREIDSYIKTEYPGTNKKNQFNINSNNQLAWVLFEKMEIPFGNLTDKGKDLCKVLRLQLPYTNQARQAFISACKNFKGKAIQGKKVKDPWCYMMVDKNTLAKLAPKYKWVEKLLERQKKMKILTTYVNGIQERIKYGTIQPSFLQHGTTSGRYSSRDPNFQNLPREDKSIKALIIARPGKVFVGADYSQLEPRVFAYFSKDKRLLDAFNGETDFYSVIGMEVYQKTDCLPIKEGLPEAFGIKYKDLRNKSKVIALATTYGATARQLASTTGKSVEETQKDIDSYFTHFPTIRTMMQESHDLAKKTGQVTNLFGRPRRIPEAKMIESFYKYKTQENLPYHYRSLLNLAVNHRIQSTGASIVNRSAIEFNKLCKELDVKAPIVIQVHDSLVAECDEQDAESVKILLQTAMEDTIKLEGIKLEAIPKIGKTLADV